MTKFSVIIDTNRVNNKWIQSIEVFEGKLETYDCQLEHEDGHIVTSRIVNELKSIYPSLSFLSQEIIEASEIGRQEFLMENKKVYNIAVEHDASNNQLMNHFCCCSEITEIDRSCVVTRQDARLNGIPNCDMKPHFKRFDKTSHSMEYFDRNKCPVCMKSYTKILEDDRHIVIPPCGHPICCKCSDEILRIKPECPCCREEMDRDDFEVMKFDINIKLVPQERKIYY